MRTKVRRLTQADSHVRVYSARVSALETTARVTREIQEQHRSGVLRRVLQVKFGKHTSTPVVMRVRQGYVQFGTWPGQELAGVKGRILVTGGARVFSSHHVKSE